MGLRFRARRDRGVRLVEFFMGGIGLGNCKVFGVQRLVGLLDSREVKCLLAMEV